jgi:U2-associated protein SR140
MDDLFDTFGSFGPLASAKILYPRPEDERPREFLCGFVAYISRTDAERALYAMAGEKLRGSDLRVSWARPITIPPKV